MSRWRGTVLAGIMLLLLALGAATLVMALLPASALLRADLHTLDRELQGQAWDEADATLQAIVDRWSRQRWRVALDTGRDDIDFFEVALLRLHVYVEARQAQEARAELAQMRALSAKF